MVGLEVKAGDAILFTEALRHGGFTIENGVSRKTLHVGYGPFWLMSQNIAVSCAKSLSIHRSMPALASF
jgi:ectoine hydroxylase-related dioxygenase (phytanoyl-CoA dioxygenase family)